MVASDKLREETDLKLIQDVSTRWSSSFYMIERFLQLRPPTNINCHSSAPPMLNAIDIIHLNDICEILLKRKLLSKMLVLQSIDRKILDF